VINQPAVMTEENDLYQYLVIVAMAIGSGLFFGLSTWIFSKLDASCVGQAA